jgi:Flp pilus assembly pilin Flp
VRLHLHFYSTLINRLRNEEGQALVEYSIILIFVAIASVVACTALGVSVDELLQGAIDLLKF